MAIGRQPHRWELHLRAPEKNACRDLCTSLRIEEVSTFNHSDPRSTWNNRPRCSIEFDDPEVAGTQASRSEGPLSRNCVSSGAFDDDRCSPNCRRRHVRSEWGLRGSSKDADLWRPEELVDELQRRKLGWTERWVWNSINRKTVYYQWFNNNNGAAGEI